MRSHPLLKTTMAQIENTLLKERILWLPVARRNLKLAGCQTKAIVQGNCALCCEVLCQERAALRYCLISVLAPELVRRTIAKRGLPLPIFTFTNKPGSHINLQSPALFASAPIHNPQPHLTQTTPAA